MSKITEKRGNCKTLKRDFHQCDFSHRRTFWAIAESDEFSIPQVSFSKLLHANQILRFHRDDIIKQERGKEK